MKTLSDFIDPGVEILSVGLNPSPLSVRDGYPFANPQNRFWKALNKSRLVAGALSPGVDAMNTLLTRERIGFTDLVKRPTRGVSELRAADYRVGSERLMDIISTLSPGLVWFHGKVACSKFCRQHAELRSAVVVWGKQAFALDNAVVFVSPNPSPANAVFSLADIVKSYDELAGLRARVFNRRAL